MKVALAAMLLFVVGALGGGLLALYVALPAGTVECGDACGTRALMFALRCGLVAGLLLAAIGWVAAKSRQAKQSERR